jgi:hypothetical protein
VEGCYEGHPCWEDEVGVSQICGEGDQLLALWALPCVGCCRRPIAKDEEESVARAPTYVGCGSLVRTVLLQLAMKTD